METLATLCTREVVGIDAGASLREAATLMCDEHVGALVVMTGDDPGQVVGIVTDRDLALEVLGRPGQPSDLQIGNLANSPPLAVASSASVREAVQAMAQSGVRRLLVVDEDGGVVGLVSSDDLLCAVSEELEALAKALRTNIQREKAGRKVVSVAAGRRPVFPSFGTAAAQ